MVRKIMILPFLIVVYCFSFFGIIFSFKKESFRLGNTNIILMVGNIVEQSVDVIVNAANENLNHAGGVARAISDAAGISLQEYSNTMPIVKNGKRCLLGGAVITPAFDLEQKGVKKIIHTVGPRGTDFKREQLLYSAYRSSLDLAKANGLKSIAFPAISTAIFGYDITLATPIAFKVIEDYIKENPEVFTEIRFVVFSDKDFIVYKNSMNRMLGLDNK